MSNMQFNAQSMHTVAKTIQSNGHAFHDLLQSIWSYYQPDMQGAFPEFASHLTDFMNLCKAPSLSLAQNRVDLGTKLDQAATAATQTDKDVAAGFK